MPVSKIYLPVLVGAKKNYKLGMNYQRDDTGENISAKNSNYNELTAIYWAWKNLEHADVVGLVHYRRYFFHRGQKSLENVLSKADVEKLLKKYDVLLPRKRMYYIETNYQHYIHAHHKEPLDQTRLIIQAVYPEYLPYFDTVMSKRGAHMFNMFIMKKELFDEYATWLFDVLKRLENNIDISNYSAQEARVYGYVSELLMDVWILKNQIKYKDVRWGQIGSTHTIKKIVFLLLRKFKIGGKRTHF